ncbi:hypothetical protein [Desulfocurvibacter africanus]|nr:hypothetical protein [Desulfocurvibacter africanus]
MGMNEFLQVLPLLAILAAVIGLRILSRKRPMSWDRLKSRRKRQPRGK